MVLLTHLLSDPALILATVEAATGSPRVEARVMFPRVARLLPTEVDRKLGNASSSMLLKLSVMMLGYG